MKVMKLALIIPLLFMLGSKVQAQGRYGATPEDSINCILNLNFYNDEYKRKAYDAAYEPWSQALRLCPTFSANLYIHGVNILRERMKNVSDPTHKKALADSLLMMYDKRIEYNFPKTNKADVYFRKADVVEEFYPNDNEAIINAYYDVINADKNNINLTAVAKVMLESEKLYKANKMSDDKFTDTYTALTEIVDERIRQINRASTVDTVALADAQMCKAAIENAFISTDAANCENLIKLFTPRFEANKQDINTVGMVVNILMTRECTQNDLFYQAAEAYYQLDPSPKSASTLAAMFMSKGETDKALQYYKDAIEGQTDMVDKSAYQVTLAGIYLQQGQTGQAMTYANQAIRSNPRNGRAYMILGNIYAGIKGCGNDAVSQRSVFWVAVDMLQKAKQLESSDNSFVETVNRQINTYRQHFPTYDDCFDLDILDGQTYTVNCGGINATTTVRTRK